MMLNLNLLILFSGISCVIGSGRRGQIPITNQDSNKCKPKTTEGRLKDDLLCGYDSSVIPNKHNNTVIKMAGFPTSFNWIAEDRKLIWMSFEIYLQWTDSSLVWDVSNYDGLDTTYTDTSKIWAPNIFISDPPQRQSDRQMKCELHSDGQLSCASMEMVTARCTFDLTYFPYDSHSCTMVFSLQSTKGSALDLDFLHTSDIDLLKYFYQHGSYNIKSLKTRRTSTVFDKFRAQSVNIEYSFILERKNSTYIVTYGAPAFVMIMMTLCVFWLELQSSARIILPALAIISHLIVIQCLMQAITPTSEHLPFIMAFFRDSLLMTGMSIVWTVVARLLCTSAYSPYWIYLLSTKLNNNHFVKLVLPHDLFIKPIPSEEDESSLVVHRDCIEQQWRILTILMDRILFGLYALSYLFIYFKLAQ